MIQHNYLEISSCEVCGNTDLKSVLDLGSHPMCDDLIRIGENRVCIEYPIEILFCKTCNTAHQRFQVPKHDLFPHSYHYRSRFTADVLDGMKGLVDSCLLRFGSLSGKKVLDIGCNDGSLLDYFRLKGSLTIGVEPTGACSDAANKGHITYSNFLSEELAAVIVDQHGQPDIITFTNVFAHIEDLQSVLRSLIRLMHKDTFIIIENHYLGSVLDCNQFDTFYHEHPRTYSYTSFVQMAKTLGTQICRVEFPSRYGGNIRVFLGNPTSDELRSNVDLAVLALREDRFLSDFATLKRNIDCWLSVKKAFLHTQFLKYGKLRAKAFPGRAAILVKLLQLDESIVFAAFEKPGSLKVGHYIPGTRIPIYSDDKLFSLSDQSLTMLNLAWHIPNEISLYLTKNGYQGNIINIIDSDDFIIGSKK